MKWKSSWKDSHTSWLVELKVSYAHHIGKDASGGDGCSCTITTNDHRGVIAFGGKAKDVVGTFEVIQWMFLADFLESYFSLSFVPLGNKAPTFVFAR